MAVTVLGCASAPTQYRTSVTLKSVVVGDPEEKLVTTFGSREVRGGGQEIKVEPMQIRASRRTSAGEALEIGEVPLADPASGQVTYYWFLFKDGRLAMWGRPDDWRLVSQQSAIDFQPHGAPPVAK